MYIHIVKACPSESAGNVPADLLPPEPERFCGRREVLYLTPSPIGLPDLYQSRPDGLVPI